MNFLEQNKKNLFSEAGEWVRVSEWVQWCPLPVIWIEFNVYLFYVFIYYTIHNQCSIHAKESAEPYPSFISLAKSTLHKHYTFTRIFQSFSGSPLSLLAHSAVSITASSLYYWLPTCRIYYQHIVKGLWKIMMSLEKIFGAAVFFILMSLLCTI